MTRPSTIFRIILSLVLLVLLGTLTGCGAGGSGESRINAGGSEETFTREQSVDGDVALESGDDLELATAGVEIAVLANGQPIASTETDSNGHFRVSYPIAIDQNGESTSNIEFVVSDPRTGQASVIPIAEDVATSRKVLALVTIAEDGSASAEFENAKNSTSTGQSASPGAEDGTETKSDTPSKNPKKSDGNNGNGNNSNSNSENENNNEGNPDSNTDPDSSNDPLPPDPGTSTWKFSVAAANYSPNAEVYVMAVAVNDEGDPEQLIGSSQNAVLLSRLPATTLEPESVKLEFERENSEVTVRFYSSTVNFTFEDTQIDPLPPQIAFSYSKELRYSASPLRIRRLNTMTTVQNVLGAGFYARDLENNLDFGIADYTLEIDEETNDEVVTIESDEHYIQEALPADLEKFTVVVENATKTPSKMYALITNEKGELLYNDEKEISSALIHVAAAKLDEDTKSLQPSVQSALIPRPKGATHILLVNAKDYVYDYDQLNELVTHVVRRPLDNPDVGAIQLKILDSGESVEWVEHEHFAHGLQVENATHTFAKGVDERFDPKSEDIFNADIDGLEAKEPIDDLPNEKAPEATATE